MAFPTIRYFLGPTLEWNYWVKRFKGLWDFYHPPQRLCGVAGGQQRKQSRSSPHSDASSQIALLFPEFRCGTLVMMVWQGVTGMTVLHSSLQRESCGRRGRGSTRRWHCLDAPGACFGWPQCGPGVAAPDAEHKLHPGLFQMLRTWAVCRVWSHSRLTHSMFTYTLMDRHFQPWLFKNGKQCSVAFCPQHSPKWTMSDT